MASARFFYSTDGTNTYGPVVEEELRQLFQNGVIGPTSFLCREGATEWQRFDPKMVVPRVIEPERPPPYEPPPLVVTPEMQERMQMPPEFGMWEPGVGSFILIGIWLVVTIGGAILFTIFTPAPQGDAAEMIGYRLGGFVAQIVILGVIPYFVSKFWRDFMRVLVRTILSVGFWRFSCSWANSTAPDCSSRPQPMP